MLCQGANAVGIEGPFLADLGKKLACSSNFVRVRIFKNKDKKIVAKLIVLRLSLMRF